MHLNRHHTLALLTAGFEIFENNVCEEGSRPGHIVVADPVLCMSGSRRWAEVRRVVLRTPRDVFRFINERD